MTDVISIIYANVNKPNGEKTYVRVNAESATSGKALIVSHIFLAGHWAPQRASFGCDGRLRTEFYRAIAESFA